MYFFPQKNDIDDEQPTHEPEQGNSDEKLFRETCDSKFQCLLCFLKVGNVGNIIKHIRSHIHCDKCGHGFAGYRATFSLDRHMNTCKGPQKKDFKCPLCPNKYKFKSAMIRHQRACKGGP
jgi:hypothetical protein